MSNKQDQKMVNSVLRGMKRWEKFRKLIDLNTPATMYERNNSNVVGNKLRRIPDLTPSVGRRNIESIDKAFSLLKESRASRTYRSEYEVDRSLALSGPIGLLP